MNVKISPRCERGNHRDCDGTFLHAMGEFDCACLCHLDDEEHAA